MKTFQPITALLFTGLLIPALAYAQIDRLNTTTLAEPAATTLTSPLLITDPAFLLPMKPEPTNPALTDPNATTTDTNTTDPANTGDTAGTTLTTDTTTTDPFTGTGTDTTRPTDPDVPPADTTTPETPSLLVPDPNGTFVPAPGFTPRTPLNPSFPPAETETPPTDCPVIEPTPSNPNPVPACPTATPVPVVPQAPYFLLATPFLAVIMLWMVLSYMGRRQGALENRYVERNLRHRHAQTVSHARERTYREMLDFLANSNSSDQTLDGQGLQQHLSKLALLGSPEINALGEKTRLAFQNNDRAAIKPLMKELAARVKQER